jgi:hypothetical protein
MFTPTSAEFLAWNTILPRRPAVLHPHRGDGTCVDRMVSFDHYQHLDPYAICGKEERCCDGYACTCDYNKAEAPHEVLSD